VLEAHIADYRPAICAELLTALFQFRKLVVYEVHRPDLVRPGGIAAIAAKLCHHAQAGRLEPHLQAFQLVEPTDALDVQMPPFTRNTTWMRR
jgi:hypothetical protein